MQAALHLQGFGCLPLKVGIGDGCEVKPEAVLGVEPRQGGADRPGGEACDKGAFDCSAVWEPNDELCDGLPISQQRGVRARSVVVEYDEYVETQLDGQASQPRKAFDQRINTWALTGTASLDSTQPSLTLRQDGVTVDRYGIPPLPDQKAGNIRLGDNSSSPKAGWIPATAGCCRGPTQAASPTARWTPS